MDFKFDNPYFRNGVAKMKEEYINPFIESAQSVLSMVCGIEAKSSNVFLRQSPFLVNHVIIMVGFIGEIKGQVFYELSLDTTKNIVSTMMGGIPVEELDEMSKSAISEMGNMFMGNTSILFANKNINIDITPPSLLVGEKIEISNNAPTIVILLELQGIGTLTMNVMSKELM
jgi:chemotaxis protein CheX